MGQDVTTLPGPALLAAVFVAVTAAGAAALLAFAFLQRAQRPAHRIGEHWGGEHVDVVEWSGGEGYVRAGGELWRAISAAPLAPGARARVLRTDGLVLEVSEIDAAEGPQTAP